MCAWSPYPVRVLPFLRFVALMTLSLVGCERRITTPELLRSQPASTQRVNGPSTVTFEGACDASGAVPLDAWRFAVADDEDSVLRIYDAEVGGPPLATVDVSDALDLKSRAGKGKKRRKSKKGKNRKKRKPKRAESDIEAATLLGSHAYWLTSHALTKSGKRDLDRFRFFATELPSGDSEAHLIGSAYRGLIDDMLNDSRLRALGLAAASEKAAKDPDGLNLEGLTATPDGKLLIGFRSPAPRGRALVVPLSNPEEVIQGEPAEFEAPILLPLGGRGVRALSYWRGRYLVIAGHHDGSGRSALYQWDGRSDPSLEPSVVFDDANPEGFFTPDERGDILVLSDDGGRVVAGERCKSLKDPGQKRFRGLRVRLDDVAERIKLPQAPHPRYDASP